MLLILGDASPYYAFQQSDLVGRIIVVILFMTSILAWTIIVEKWLQLRAASRHVNDAMKRCANCPSSIDILLQGHKLRGPLQRVTEHVTATIARIAGVESDVFLRQVKSRPADGALPNSVYERVKASTEAKVDEEVLGLETRLGVLGSIVGVSPFLGLLGTVWGVMKAFSGMAAAGRAEINAIAPGVSGALLTTVVGLIVAIPALVGYNMLVGRVKQLTIRIDNFSNQLLNGLIRKGGS